MKKLLFFIPVFVSIICCLPAHAVTFSLIDGHFNSELRLEVDLYNPDTDTGNLIFDKRETVNSPVPANGYVSFEGIGYGSVASYSEIAAFTEINPENNTLGFDYLYPRDNYIVTSSNLTFKPDFSGFGAINFYMNGGFADVLEGCIYLYDTSTGEFLLELQKYSLDTVIPYEYSFWNPDHVYRLSFSICNEMMGFAPCRFGLSTDMYFSNVPEPSTFYLFIPGFIVLAVLMAKRKLKAQR